ncbi:HlyD family secretion protein [Thalassobius sp. Cn5-15]|uniref:HlyD family secretion protein n=1 Tax=Thalassobius sp. Cn5-15 TaxID=2917763 RepID=UPI001EF21B5D|nr:HlyD family efflux transporter periplasmic adaptor subunit [Thalassobius sp. Cn5-15]MCG7494813.1 HlyD family efflux transporter periplasmic adaptor subunit [Thalassobius sp. Cn5-15]
MRVEHRSPHADLDYMVRAPLSLLTPEGEEVVIREWSLQGLKWPESAPPRPDTAHLAVPFQGVDVRFPVTLEAAPDTREVFFKDLTGRQREVLALFYRALLSGRMVASGEVITSLDTPVDLVPVEETEAEAVAKIGQRKKITEVIRTVVHVVIYVALFLGVMATIGTNAFNAVNRIAVQHGRVVAPVAALTALRPGLVRAVEVAPGALVAAGDTLAHIEDPELVSRLRAARIAYSATSAEVKRLEKALARLDKLRGVKDEVLRMVEVGLIYEAQLGPRGFDALRKRWDQLRQKEELLGLERDDLTSAQDPLEVTHRLLSARLNDQVTELRQQRSIRDGYKARINAAKLIAPYDGVVQAVLVQPGQYVLSGQPVVEMEDDAPRHVVGWVDAKYAEDLFPGMPALVGVNPDGIAQQVTGRIRDVRAGDIPNRPGEYGIEVTVQINGFTNAELRQDLRVGAPVSILADRQMLSGLRGWMGALAGPLFEGVGDV